MTVADCPVLDNETSWPTGYAKSGGYKYDSKIVSPWFRWNSSNISLTADVFDCWVGGL